MDCVKWREDICEMFVVLGIEYIASFCVDLICQNIVAFMHVTPDLHHNLARRVEVYL